MVGDIEQGLAESFLGIGEVLAANNGVDAAQVYFRFALMLIRTSISPSWSLPSFTVMSSTSPKRLP